MNRPAAPLPAPEAPLFVPDWRARRSAAFDLPVNSSARRVVEIDLFGERRPVYANANLSLYSGQRCNARCHFCIEEVRPASRGRRLADQRRVEPDDERYFAALAAVLEELAPLDPSVSVTGGEPSLDPRLPRILRELAARGVRKRVVTSNGSGLLLPCEGRPMLEWLAATGVHHLNISRAHWEEGANARLMGFAAAPDRRALARIVAAAAAGGVQVRLSCVLVRGAVDHLAAMRRYLEFARSVGVRRVIFRELMRVDPATALPGPQLRFAARRRVLLDPLYAALSAAADFRFVKQVVGYYYYVEVWRQTTAEGELELLLEGADLARLEQTRRAAPALIHELVFHPEGRLCSTWQPWDGVLFPRPG